MLSSLRRIVSQTTNFSGGKSATIHFPPFIYPQKNPSLFIFRFSSSPNHKNSSISSSFVVNYLINSCGLSERQAIKASRELNFKTSSNPDSVLTLLENYGFTKPHISKTISKFPEILLYNTQKTLQPKFDFFNSKGLSGIDLVKFISSCPTILERSLQDSIIPCCDTLKNIAHSDKNVVTIIKHHAWLLTGGVYLKNLKVNVELLREEGLPQSNVSKFLIRQPSALTISTTRFEEIVCEIKGMGFDPAQMTFLLAINGLTAMSKLTRETKVNAFKKWGLTEEEIQNAFKKQPQCLICSEKKIISIMEYLVNQMGYNPSLIAKCPSVFSYSLEKRIIPRCVVIQYLVSKGQIKEQIPLSSLFVPTDKLFLKRHVSKHEVQVPELSKVLQWF